MYPSSPARDPHLLHDNPIAQKPTENSCLSVSAYPFKAKEYNLIAAQRAIIISKSKYKGESIC
jgi:hypothetical protein